MQMQVSELIGFEQKTKQKTNAEILAKTESSFCPKKKYFL